VTSWIDYEIQESQPRRPTRATVTTSLIGMASATARSSAARARRRALVRLRRVDEAVKKIDEAMAVAVSGSLRPRTACLIYCQTLTVCGELGDYRRAGEWTVAAQRCCVRESIVPASGDCRIGRAALAWRVEAPHGSSPQRPSFVTTASDGPSGGSGRSQRVA
jgi:hypothetical protein